jgi:choice-of-anchor A domain-containing protein
MPCDHDNARRTTITTARLGHTVLAVGAVLTAFGAFALPHAAAAARAVPQPRAAIGNPVAGNQGFLVFVQHDADVSSNENEGTMAVGGDLLLHGDYRIANHPPTHPYTVPGDAQPTGLVVGGAIDWAHSASGGKLQMLSSTYVKIGTSAGSDVINTGSPTELVPSGAGAGSAAHVILTTEQPTASIVAPGLIDFDSAFTAYRARSTAMAACPDTVTPTDAQGTALTEPYASGTQAYLTLSTTQTNVWTVSASDMDALANITLRDLPTASSPLVVNVVGTGSDYTWNPPSLAGFGATAAPYVLWNFPEATTLTMTGANSVDGTVFAPRAKLVDLNPGNIQGNVIAESLQHGGGADSANGGEMHDFPFAGDVDCEADAPSDSPSPSASLSTSPSPAPSESTTSSESSSESAQPASPRPTTSTTPTSGTGPRRLAATGTPLSLGMLAAGLVSVLIGAAMTRGRRRSGYHR